MAQLLKRIVVAQRSNVVISDLGTGVYLKNTGDSIDLLNRKINNESVVRFTLEQICRSRSLDSLLKTGYIKIYDENNKELSILSGESGERSTNLATLNDIDNTGVLGWVDYNDSGTKETPLLISENSWTQITNDGQGIYSVTDYLPSSYGSLLNSNTIDLRKLNIGNTIVLRNDFILKPTVNGTYVTFRLKFGSGSGIFYLTTQVGSLMNGAGIDYPIVINNLFYIGNNDILNSPVEFQIRCSDNTMLVNNGFFLIVLGT